MQKPETEAENQKARLLGCPICNLEKKQTTLSDIKSDCPRCGKFEITAEANSLLKKPEKEKRFLVSHYIRNHNQGLLTQEILEKILTNKNFPQPKDQINNLILFLGNETKFFGRKYYDFSHVLNLASVAGVVDEENYKRIFEELEKLEIIKRKSIPGNGFAIWSIELTMDGWNRHEQISKSQSRQVFMALRFEKKVITILEEIFFINFIQQLKAQSRS